MSERFTFLVVSIVAYTVINFSLLEIAALPASTSAPTTHIISYVKQKKVKAKYDEFPNFDFESITSNLSDVKKTPQSLFGSLMQPQLNTNLDSSNEIKENGIIQTEYNNSTSKQKTDDNPNSKQNTLYNSNEIFGQNDQHESPMTNDSSIGMWNRVKQSIPVLEPVKHLLNTVRDGSFNHTTHYNRHRQLVGANSGGGGADHMNDSSAIETEEEREMVNDSTSFKLLELLGTIGGMIWGFFTNIQKIFAASSGSASAASSGGSRR